jgi:hypothetical protein
MPDNFFALLNDGSIRRIALLQGIEQDIRNVFVNFGPALYAGKDEVEFDGDWKIDDDEVAFVTIALPAEFDNVSNNPIGIPILNLQTDQIKALFWYENDEYFFQNFDNRKLLRHRNVLFVNNQTFNRLTQDAFVIDNIVNAVYRNGKFYFSSYPNANKIFSLLEFYQEATNEELTAFAGHANITISDQEWFLNNSNSVIRKHVTLLRKTGVLDNANTKKVKSGAKKFKIKIDLDDNGKIIFPKDRGHCKNILIYLNEQFYVGLITNRHYKTNSKKDVT